MHTGPLHQDLCFRLLPCFGFTYSTPPPRTAHALWWIRVLDLTSLIWGFGTVLHKTPLDTRIFASTCPLLELHVQPHPGRKLSPRYCPQPPPLSALW